MSYKNQNLKLLSIVCSGFLKFKHTGGGASVDFMFVAHVLSTCMYVYIHYTHVHMRRPKHTPTYTHNIGSILIMYCIYLKPQHKSVNSTFKTIDVSVWFDSTLMCYLCVHVYWSANMCGKCRMIKNGVVYVHRRV